MRRKKYHAEQYEFQFTMKTTFATVRTYGLRWLVVDTISDAVIFEAETLRQAIQWCDDNKLTVIKDEK